MDAVACAPIRASKRIRRGELVVLTSAGYRNAHRNLRSPGARRAEDSLVVNRERPVDDEVSLWGSLRRNLVTAFAGFAMLAIFALAAYLMYARVLPALLAVPLMALGIAAVAGAGAAGLETTIVDGTTRLAPVIVTVIFGAWLSRVTLSTGIAETIVTYAAEFGGDRPAVLALALCAAVAVLFTSLTGLGAVIMVGSIVLPIMMTIGVPRKTAATLFMLAFALGFIFNIAQWTFYTKTFGVERVQMQPFAFALAAIDLIALCVFAAVRFRATRGYATWALEADEPPARKRVPAYALIAPLLPIALYFFGGLNPVVAFALAALYGAVSATPRNVVPVLIAAAIRGIEDVAPAIVLFMGIGMLLTATALPSVRAALEPLVAAVAPRSWFAYVIVFGLFSPLALYRGPLNPFGVGIAVYTVLAGLGVLPAVTLVAAVMAVVQVQNVCDPTNTQNVWVANFTGVRVDEITKLTLPFQVAVATLATLTVVIFGGALLGAQPFTALPARAAAAAELGTGPFAPPASADTVAVAPAGGAAAGLSAHALARELGGGWGLHTLELSGPPADAPCSARAYAAVLLVSADDRDVGLKLEDCANWPVDEWYGDARPDAERAALGLLFRFRMWTVDHRALADSLLSRGLAFRSSDPPTYFYSLFKTDDGQMRAYVRPGGPAYDAGLRTNDVVSKLDGKYWWEYGTFQTQRRAYDGKPHAFVVTRAGHELTIVLGAPFVPAAAASAP